MQVGAGLAVGIGLVIVVDRIIANHEFKPRDIPDADFKKLVLIVGVLTVHSVPEGVAYGEDLPGNGRRELLVGVVLGVAIMLPVMVLTV